MFCQVAIRGGPSSIKARAGSYVVVGGGGALRTDDGRVGQPNKKSVRAMRSSELELAGGALKSWLETPLKHMVPRLLLITGGRSERKQKRKISAAAGREGRDWGQRVRSGTSIIKQPNSPPAGENQKRCIQASTRRGILTMTAIPDALPHHKTSDMCA
ncbi:hypothetical protein BDBG_06943 [Blastomyces gilchristii SLH14081]|uniref:Uncharacterized protein n=1 Tax=Blastomyces gilchristii (strain SLH14081) TaxID=559298 RepID=A0A179UW66_BLAGS|nr:uncharacterized protein BDBG_06943 [Blastomyces gilchristii SLH14081]OAT11459.1 hypothetical protein BDBG_06943 [Blastomyces gilchristii SLH14081]